MDRGQKEVTVFVQDGQQSFVGGARLTQAQRNNVILMVKGLSLINLLPSEGIIHMHICMGGRG